jgi:hypothetical protein
MSLFVDCGKQASKRQRRVEYLRPFRSSPITIHLVSFNMVSSLLDSHQQEFSTYEATKAQERNSAQADKIHWEKDAAFRNQPYRNLHHQDGLIGTFQIRLLEAADLKRSHWSPLGLGPVKLLGLSKAFGPVSSFVSCSWDRGTTSSKTYSPDSKPAAKPLDLPPCFVSPVNPQDNNPVWTNCYFDLPLVKGMWKDSQPIRLKVRVDEDGTVMENLLPGVPSGGDSRLLGTGSLDLTSLCLGQIVEGLEMGQPQVGVLDTWIPIRKEAESSPKHNMKQEPQQGLKKGQLDDTSKPNNNNSSIMGRVRVLVSYLPNGMEPQPNDIVALEAFARQDPRKSSCRAVLPPLLPLHVVRISGPWLLVEYELSSRHRRGNCGKAFLRLHRNSVFVIERKNYMDGTLNLALMPADVFMSTPLGNAVKDLLGPAFVAGRQLLMPALLSSKLVWMAVRTTALASVTGVQAATSAFVNEGSNSLTQDNDADQHHKQQKYKFVTL